MVKDNISQHTRQEIQQIINSNSPFVALDIAKMASSLGPELTRSSLLPYLIELEPCLEEEQLIQITFALQALVSYVGGPSYIKELMPLLNTMMLVDSKEIQEESLLVLASLCKMMSSEDVDSSIYPFFVDLASSEWFNYVQVAASMIPLIFSYISQEKKKSLISLARQIATHEYPFVRRRLAEVLTELDKAPDAALLTEEMLPCLLLLFDDNDVGVRATAVTALPVFFDLLADKSVVLSLLLKSSADISWRVRHCWIKVTAIIIRRVDSETQAQLAKAYAKLLDDPEDEVKAFAASSLTEVADSFSVDLIVQTIIPLLTQCLRSNREFVRKSLAPSVAGLSPCLGKENTLIHLKPIIVSLLEDPCVDVRLSVVTSLKSFSKTIGIENLSIFLPTIAALARDESNWRIRKAVIEYVTELAEQLGAEVFDEKFSTLYLAWLADQVYEVRFTAVKNMVILASNFGVEWAVSYLIPKIISLSENTTYIHRLTTILALKEIASVCSQAIIEAHILPVIIIFSEDKVVNVRISAVQVLGYFTRMISPQATNSIIRPALLQRVSGDESDKDVIYYASEALKMI